MKKILMIGLSVAMFLSAAASYAQVKYGVIGGVSFPATKIKELKDSKVNGWNAGLTLKLGLPAGFSIQPSLMYSTNTTKLFVLDEEGNQLPDPEDPSKKLMNKFTQGSVILPVSFQWGPDLLIFRPFLDVTPFVGYALTSSLGDLKNSWNDLNRFNYGVAAGVGVELWCVQIVARYNWNLGTFADKNKVKDAFKSINKNNMNGITLTAAILFGKGKKK